MKKRGRKYYGRFVGVSTFFLFPSRASSSVYFIFVNKRKNGVNSGNDSASLITKQDEEREEKKEISCSGWRKGNIMNDG